MRMSLALFLDPIDGQEVVRIMHYNNNRTMFEGRRFMCPFFDVVRAKIRRKARSLLFQIVFIN